ncbi:MAG: hypothetical protein FJX56_11130 [Alphaproteobacteria bacterium]|nr:hypothetical protein [Alphaproteobacteria bacterium]
MDPGQAKGHRSSAGAERHFCGDCGTPLTFRSVAAPTEVDVTVASLDDPFAFPPSFHIWTMSRLGWFETADHLPRYADAGSDRRP